MLRPNGGNLDFEVYL